MNRIPFGDEPTAELRLADWERQLEAAEARKAHALARLAVLDEHNPDHFDAIDDAGSDHDAASDEIGEIKAAIDDLDRDLWYAIPARRAA